MFCLCAFILLLLLLQSRRPLSLAFTACVFERMELFIFLGNEATITECDKNLLFLPRALASFWQSEERETYKFSTLTLVVVVVGSYRGERSIVVALQNQ